MVSVRLDNIWTDSKGAVHDSGETVEVDPATLAELEAQGIVASSESEPAVTESVSAATNVTDEADETDPEYMGPTLPGNPTYMGPTLPQNPTYMGPTLPQRD